VKLAALLQSVLFDAGEDPDISRACEALLNSRRMDVNVVQFVLKVRS
jgi:hypothetical protein